MICVYMKKKMKFILYDLCIVLIFMVKLVSSPTTLMVQDARREDVDAEREKNQSTSDFFTIYIYLIYRVQVYCRILKTESQRERTREHGEREKKPKTNF